MPYDSDELVITYDLEWTCPGCGDVVTSEVSLSQDDIVEGYAMVDMTCSSCSARCNAALDISMAVEIRKIYQAGDMEDPLTGPAIAHDDDEVTVEKKPTELSASSAETKEAVLISSTGNRDTALALSTGAKKTAEVIRSPETTVPSTSSVIHGDEFEEYLGYVRGGLRTPGELHGRQAASYTPQRVGGSLVQYVCNKDTGKRCRVSRDRGKTWVEKTIHLNKLVKGRDLVPGDMLTREDEGHSILYEVKMLRNGRLSLSRVTPVRQLTRRISRSDLWKRRKVPVCTE